MPRNEESRPLAEAAIPEHNQSQISPLAAEMGWDEPHNVCATCGDEFLNVAFHRCGEHVDGPWSFCPCCGFHMARWVDMEVVKRIRGASNDVAEAWVEGGHTDRFWSWQNVLKFRAKAGVR